MFIQCCNDLLHGEIELNLNICLCVGFLYTRNEDVRRFFVLLRGPGRVKFCSLYLDKTLLVWVWCRGSTIQYSSRVI